MQNDDWLGFLIVCLVAIMCVIYFLFSTILKTGS